MAESYGKANGVIIFDKPNINNYLLFYKIKAEILHELNGRIVKPTKLPIFNVPKQRQFRQPVIRRLNAVL
ncbi:hypothetical protein BGL52_13495 [Lacticaseibacillus casei]|uniref:Uncharacterized protein n=1 Tax=Lacticaseibacillus casei TaxID=1582 RepID=A0AAN1F0V9_LACCA|nr:hypothetical protein BGL52_13495 [Lacticaseibacillus casei]